MGLVLVDLPVPAAPGPPALAAVRPPPPRAQVAQQPALPGGPGSVPNPWREGPHG